MADIHPTHTCFDDALDFFAEAGIPPNMIDEFRVVHGICVAPDHQSYAHAWVEHVDTRQCIQAGIFNGKRIFHAAPLATYYARLRVQEITRYTPNAALRENHRTGHYGPWVEKYRALCSRNKSVWRPVGTP